MLLSENHKKTMGEIRSTILLVDDDEDMCKSLSDVIATNSTCEVTYITDPLEALDELKSNEYSLAIIDYKMPKMNGLQLLKAVKERYPNLPVFILTAFITDELTEQVIKEGAVKVLSKFVWPNELIAYIRDAIK